MSARLHGGYHLHDDQPRYRVTKIRYLSHPEVQIDPTIPVPTWNLSAEGRARAMAMLKQPWVANLSAIVSSEETKALELAEILANATGLTIDVRAETGENDRSSTGFVCGERFSELVEAFFAKPQESVQGWERSADAQQRIVHQLGDLFGTDEREIAVVGHGGVGTLWYCYLTGEPIDRRWDQPSQGHYFTVDRASREVEHWWLPLDAIETT